MDKYVTEKPKTVCMECESVDPFMDAESTDSDRMPMVTAEKALCFADGALEGPKQWDPVTGKEHTVRPKCVDVNDGECAHFEPKGEKPDAEVSATGVCAVSEEA